ncbi:MAG: hypothetical protein ACE5G1_00880 [bacterium]
MKKALIILPIALVVLVVAYLVYDLVKPSLTSPCESIFQQTAVSLKSNLEIIKSKGGVFVGREKIQDLAERAQMAALNLKTCCIMSESGKLNAAEFLKCKSNVEQYLLQMDVFAQQIDAARQAKQAGDKTLAAQKVVLIKQILAKLEKSAGKIEQHARELKAAQPTEKTDSGSKKAAGQQEGSGTPAVDTGGRINLPAAKNGGQVLVGTSDAWLKTIDGEEKLITFYESNLGAKTEAVYAFKDVRPAEFDLFSVLVLETRGSNLKDFELLWGNESATGTFHPIGRFRTQNIKLFKTPYQEFKFPPVTAKYLKVRLLSTWEYALNHAREFQLWGSLK